MSIEVIDVEVENQLLNLGFGLDAERAVVHIRVVGSIAVKLAVILLVSIENSLWNNLEVVKGLWKRR